MFKKLPTKGELHPGQLLLLKMRKFGLTVKREKSESAEVNIHPSPSFTYWTVKRWWIMLCLHQLNRNFLLFLGSESLESIQRYFFTEKLYLICLSLKQKMTKHSHFKQTLGRLLNALQKMRSDSWGIK
jgi:hypothetical protein